MKSKDSPSTALSADAAPTPPIRKGSLSEFDSHSAEETFELGRRIGESLMGGELILLTAGLGAGKTLLTKGILDALDFDVDEVTSPSFALVNLYHAKFDVYHIDLWRINKNTDAAEAVGLDEILEDSNAVVIIEWAEKLAKNLIGSEIIRVDIEGDGEETRKIVIQRVNSGGGKSEDRDQKE